MLITGQRLGFLRLNNKLAVGEGVLDLHPHHNFGNFIDTKMSLKKVQSILYTIIKKKNQLFLLAVANFHRYFDNFEFLLTFQEKNPN